MRARVELRGGRELQRRQLGPESGGNSLGWQREPIQVAKDRTRRTLVVRHSIRKYKRLEGRKMAPNKRAVNERRDSESSAGHEVMIRRQNNEGHSRSQRSEEEYSMQRKAVVIAALPAP
jgi:hypothetical protein